MRVCERARFGERGSAIESELERVLKMCVHRVVTFVAGSPRTCAFSQDTNPPAGSTASSSCILLAICAPRVRGSSVAHTESWRNRQRGNLGWMDAWTDGRGALVMYSGLLVGSNPWWWFYVVVRRRRRSAESLYVRAYVCWPQARVRFFPSTETQRSAAFCVQTSVQYKSLFGRIVSAAIHRCCRCRLP